MCLPVFFVYCFGYFIKAVEDVYNYNDEQMPSWSFSYSMFYRGMIVFSILFIYTIPLIIAVIPVALYAKDFLFHQNILSFFISTVIMFLMLIYISFVKFFIPLSLIEYMTTGRFVDTFKIISFIGSVRLFKKLYVNALFYIFLILIAIQAGSVIIIGLILTIPYGMMVIAHILGQLARIIKNNGNV